jgi:ubiquinone/menaquinone biosynthesis C-methylase UbiE
MSLGEDDRGLLASQVAYYRRRAAEYDATAYGDDLDAARARIAHLLDLLEPRGNVLEIACGTGMWTQELTGRADQLTAMDSAPEAVERARARLGDTQVELQVADVFAWEPDMQFDVVFMAFWLSHVPRADWQQFFGRVGAWLLPGGRLLMVDEHQVKQSEERFERSGKDTAIRTLRDGSEHRLVKVYLDPGELEARLSEAGWRSKILVDNGWVIVAAELQGTR